MPSIKDYNYCWGEHGAAGARRATSQKRWHRLGDMELILQKVLATHALGWRSHTLFTVTTTDGLARQVIALMKV